MSGTSAETARVASDVLQFARVRLGQPALSYAEAPARLTGGRDTEVFALRFSGAPDDVGGPLVLRLFREGGDRVEVGAVRARLEAAIQREVIAQGFPAPRPVLVGADATVAQRHFLLMERLRGKPLFETLVPPGRRAFRVGALTAATHARLHALDPAPIRAAIADVAPDWSLDPLATLDWDRSKLASEGLVPLAPALDWLREHRPASVPPVLCHSDFHALNIMVERGTVTGVLDWSDVSIADPAYDVMSTAVLHTLARVDLPRVLDPPFGVIRRALNAQYLRTYRRQRPIADSRLRYFEALVVTLRLAAIVVTRRRDAVNGLDDPGTVARLKRRLDALTGARVEVEERRPALAGAGA